MVPRSCRERLFAMVPLDLLMASCFDELQVDVLEVSLGPGLEVGRRSCAFMETSRVANLRNGVAPRAPRTSARRRRDGGVV